MGEFSMADYSAMPGVMPAAPAAVPVISVGSMGVTGPLTSWPGDPHAGSHKAVTGKMIVADYLGFNHTSCARVLPQPGGGHAMEREISACWLDLYVPAIAYVGAVAVACLLLKFCVRDPH